METLRAAVEVVLPAGDGIPSGIEVHAEEHIRDGLELSMGGASDLLAALLDGAATERGASDFVSLDEPGRLAVIRAMLSEEIADIRELAEAILVFGFGAVYSEWSGYRTGTLEPPRVWKTIGFGGPALGYPRYRDA